MSKIPPADARLRRLRATVAVVTSEFNASITDAMREAAIARARELGLAVVEARVPGAYDLPLTVQELLRRPEVDAAVAIGAIVTGETGHDVLIANACASALARISLETGKPVGLGVTGPGQTEAQARARIDRAPAAVESVVKQLQTLRSLRRDDDGVRRTSRARLRQRERRA